LDVTFPLDPLTAPSYAGPVAVLVGHTTVSAAENFVLMLADAGRMKAFGRQSAGTDGDLTGLLLPGNYIVSFTGLDVRHDPADPNSSIVQHVIWTGRPADPRAQGVGAGALLVRGAWRGTSLALALAEARRREDPTGGRR
jgi:hypothetical protein